MLHVIELIQNQLAKESEKFRLDYITCYSPPVLVLDLRMVAFNSFKGSLTLHPVQKSNFQSKTWATAKLSGTCGQLRKL